MFRRLMALMFCCCMAVTGHVWAADAGTISEATTLYASPGKQASAQLRKGRLVTINEREGAWYSITLSDGREGYVRISTVRYQEQEEESSVFGGLWSWLNSSRSPTYGNTATAGIRGMSEADIASASFDQSVSVEDLDDLAVTERDARSYAASLDLKSRDIEHLE